jgi:hypothetical protein
VPILDYVAPIGNNSVPSTASVPKWYSGGKAYDPNEVMPAASGWAINHPTKAGAPGSLSLTPTGASSAIYQDEFVNYMLHNLKGLSASKLFFQLDNEPDNWGGTAVNHNNSHPYAVTYNELAQRNITMAKAIRSVKSDAFIMGPSVYSIFGFMTLQDSNYAGKSEAAQNGAFVDYYLNQVKAASAGGASVVDALDFHYYCYSCESDAGIMQAPRDLWDTTFANPDSNMWISQMNNQYWAETVTINGQAKALGGKILAVIPKLKSKIARLNPGMKLAITEWDFGGHNIAGAIAHADTLGIFGREGLYAASWWPALDGGATETWALAAFNPYRNYDGAGSMVGDTGLQVLSPGFNPDNGSVYSMTDSSGKVYVVVINKTNAVMNANISVTSSATLTKADAYQLTSASLNMVHSAAAITVTGNAFAYAAPPLSITTLVVK